VSLALSERPEGPGRALLLGLAVNRSSGHAMLDAAALAAVQKAGKLPPRRT